MVAYEGQFCTAPNTITGTINVAKRSANAAAASMKAALEALPNNVIPQVSVSTETTSTNDMSFHITFTHNSGDIAPLGVKFGNPAVRGAVDNVLNDANVAQAQSWFHDDKTRWSCTNGYSSATDQCSGSNAINGYVSGLVDFAETTQGNKFNTVCSDRGICDYSSGLCKCFAGHTDVDCHVQNSLSMG